MKNSEPTSSPNSDLLKEAIHHHQAGRLDQAEKGYREVIKNDSGCADALSLLGTVVSSRGRIYEAIELNSQALDIAPSNHLYHHELGILYFKLKNFDKALACFEKVVKLYPRHFEAHRLGASILYDRGNYEDAIDHNCRALELNSDSYEAQYNLGLCYYQTGKYTLAEESYKKALSFNPKFHSAYTNLGALYNITHDFENAEKCWKKSIELCPDSRNPYISLGKLYRDQGRMNKARQYLEKGNALAHSDGTDAAIALMLPPV